MKKNNQKKIQKKKQAKALKQQQRRKEYIKQKRTVEEIIVHWNDLHFLDGWKSLKPAELMEKCFQFTVEDWVYQWVNPKKDRDFLELKNEDSIYELLHDTFENTLEAWSDDTKGFTENLPDRWKYNEKNKNRFISLMKSSVTSDDEITDEITDEDIIELMEKDRPEWFATVFGDMLDEMVDLLTPFVLNEIQQMTFDA